jgi:beta-lactamase regulating signal transducer with metallopeptidase domain
MNAIYETVNSLGIRFVDFALPMLVQSSMLILILLLADALMRKKVRAVFRYWIWMVVLLKLVLPSSMSSPVSLGRWFGDELAYVDITQQTAKPESKADVMPPAPLTAPIATNPEPAESVRYAPIVSPPLPDTPVETILPEIKPALTAPKPIVPPAAPMPPLRWQGILFLLWLAVVIMMGLFLLQRAVFVRGLVAQAKETDGSMTKQLEDCCKHMRVKRKVGLKIPVNATSPAVCGLFRPVILVPENLVTSLSSKQLHVVLLHELAHIKRSDLWVNLAQTILQILYFYNPLLWLANAIIRRAREQAVDETVLVAMGNNAEQYPQTLLEVAKLVFMRPVLSLRLIGVAESRDALTGRIKRILRRPIPKTAKLGIIGLLIIILFAAIILPMAKMTHSTMSVINNGPLDIKLVGVCPDGSNQLYDASGRKLGGLKNLILPLKLSWKPEKQCRDFIFEIPRVEEQLLFTTFPKISTSYTNRHIGGGFYPLFDQTGDPYKLFYSIVFDRKYRRRFFFFNPKFPIDYIDFTLRYFYGPRKEAICTFTSPFTLNKTVIADGNKPYDITFREAYNSLRTGIEMRFVTSEPFDGQTTVIMYDTQGIRYFLNLKSGHGGSRGADHTYSDVPLSLKEIAAVTFGEKPYEITFKNVKVSYPNEPARTHPEYLDIMAQRLNLFDRTPDQLRQYRFKNPQEAIDIIDIIRGTWHIRQAVESIRFGNRRISRIQISQLDKKTRDKIHKAATEWAGSGPVMQYGIQLGLMVRWPEFFDMAIERLGKGFPSHLSPNMERYWLQDNHEITNVMINYRFDELTPSQIQKLKELILKTNDGCTLHDALFYLDQTKSQEATNALWELVQDNRAWIWWPALKSWYPRVANNRRVYDEVPENIKIRLLLILENISDENLKDEARDLLKKIFTPEFAQMYRTYWHEACRKITHKFDRKAATEIFISFLQQAKSEATSRQWITNNSILQPAVYLIQFLNVWYGVNLGNLGINEPGEVISQGPRTFIEFQNLIAQAIRWYDGNRDASPVELPFAGKVVDTAGKPIDGAKLSFTKQEDYKDERGYRNQRRVEVSQITTDENGTFSVVLDPNERWYELNVTAEGFLTRERVMVDRLDDGRYRFREYNSQQDNIFILLRPGRISGTVIGADGKPFANARLELFANYHYSSTDPRRTVTTDSQGKFDVNGIATDPIQLSYTKLNQVSQGRTSRQEHGGLCGALVIENQEGQQQSGIVLDLSKSVCSLELDVKDTFGKPVDSISISFEVEMPQGSGYKYGRVFYSKEENSDGIYKFKGMPSGAWHLRINSQQFRQKEVGVNLTPEKTAYYKVVCE